MARQTTKSQTSFVVGIYLLYAVFLNVSYCHGWTTSKRFTPASSSSWVPAAIDRTHHEIAKATTTTARFVASSDDDESGSSSGRVYSLGRDEAAWKREGERIILNAAKQAGCANAEEVISIAWKSGRVVVTVNGSAFLQADENDGDEDVLYDFDEDNESEEISETDSDDDLDVNDDDEVQGVDSEAEGEDDENSSTDQLEQTFQSSSGGGVDVAAIARAINAAFEEEGEGSVGYTIAVHHEIEVTTPGAAEELSGIMFQSYRGFDVILEHMDSKTKKQKIVEGKLVGKDNDFITINQRGRMRKFKTDQVLSVKLPKAKKEKGGKR